MPSLRSSSSQGDAVRLAAAAPEGEDDGVGDGQAGSATEPGAKDSSDRRSQPSRPIIGWLDCGEIAFAKFSGEDADMACIDHTQPVDTGKQVQRSGGRASAQPRPVG